MSLPRYPKYKGSGVDWLGEVPEHWKVRRLKWLCKIQTGDKDTVEAVEEGQYPFFVRSQIVERINSFTFDCEAVLTAGDGVGVGKVFHYHDGPFDFHQRVYMLNNFSGIKGIFLFHYLRENFYKVALEGGAKSTVDSLRMPLFLNFAVAVPSHSEQVAIATFIDFESTKIDALIAEQRRLIELLKEKRQAVISHAVTKGLNPEAPMKDSGIEWIGQVPKHWEVKPFRSCIDFQEGPGIMAADFQDEGIPLLRISGAQNHWATLEGCNYLHPDRVRERWKHFRLEEGDLLISASASMGTVCEIGPDTVGSIPYTGLIRLRGIGGKMIKSFVRYVVVSEQFITQIDLLKAGATIQHFGPTHLSQMTIVRPPIEEQESIAAHIDYETACLDHLTIEANRAIDLLQERRAALISAAVTGKIDVRGLATEDAA